MYPFSVFNMDNKAHVLMEKYELGRLLGQGTFAKVYHARSTQTGHSVAVKVIDKEKITKVRVINNIKREISVMKLVRHPNIINLHEVLATKTKIYFIMEYAKGGELFDKVAKEGKLKEDVARKYFHQLIEAVDFCHSRGVYHRDLKPENILLDENENLKVSDFGLSALAESKQQDGLLHTLCGTPAYVAPEVIRKKGYDGAKVDIWSCGVILFVLLAGYLPFHDSNLMGMYRKIEKSEYKFPKWISQEARRLISGMLDSNPDTRISISGIKESSWFVKGLTKPKEPQVGVISIPSLDNQGNCTRLSNLNAFDIISLSNGFDLSALFEDHGAKQESRFVCREQANVIISKLEEAAKCMKLKINKKDGGLFKFEGLEGRKGVLCVDVEIFVLAPAIHLVEVKKTSGDAMEYQKILDEGIRPCLQGTIRDSETVQPSQVRNELSPLPCSNDGQTRHRNQQQDSQ